MFLGNYDSNRYYGSSGSGYYNTRGGAYGPPQVVEYPRYGYGSGYGSYGNSYGSGYGYGSGYDGNDNLNGLDWGNGDGVYGIGGYDGINIGGKVILFSLMCFGTFYKIDR